MTAERIIINRVEYRQAVTAANPVIRDLDLEGRQGDMVNATLMNFMERHKESMPDLVEDYHDLDLPLRGKVLSSWEIETLSDAVREVRTKAEEIGLQRPETLEPPQWVLYIGNATGEIRQPLETSGSRIMPMKVFLLRINFLDARRSENRGANALGVKLGEVDITGPDAYRMRQSETMQEYRGWIPVGMPSCIPAY